MIADELCFVFEDDIDSDKDVLSYWCKDSVPRKTKLKTLTSRKMELKENALDEKRYCSELLDVANKYCPHTYIFDSQSARSQCGRRLLRHRWGILEQEEEKETSSSSRDVSSSEAKDLERILNELSKANLIDELDTLNAMRIVQKNPPELTSYDMSDHKLLARISLDSVDPSSKLGEQIVKFATSSSASASLIASWILRLRSPLPPALVSDKIFELVSAIEDVPIALPSPRETIAWEKASSILCKFVATKSEKKKRRGSSKKKKKKKKNRKMKAKEEEEEEENEWSAALSKERRFNEQASVVEAIMAVRLARMHNEDEKIRTRVRERFERFANAKRQEGLKGLKFTAFRFDPSIKGDCTRPNLYELKLDGRVVRKSQQPGTIYNIQSSPATNSNNVRFAILVEAKESSDEYNTIGFKDENNGHLRVKGVSMRLDNGALYVDNVPVKNQKCRPVKKGDVIVVTLREKNKVTFQIHGTESKDSSRIAKCVWSSRSGHVRPTVAVRACGWQFRFVSPGSKKVENHEEGGDGKCVEKNSTGTPIGLEKNSTGTPIGLEKNSTTTVKAEKNSTTTTIEEKDDETFTITTKRKDIERLQERLFVRIFIERMGHAVLKKQNVIESQVLKILQSDRNRLTAAALRILFLSLTEMENHRNMILELALPTNVTDEIANVLLNSKNKAVVSASVDLLTFVARHLVCSTSTFRECADTRNWLSTRLLAGGTISDEDLEKGRVQSPWLKALPDERSVGARGLTSRIDKMVENTCSRRELREKKKIDSFLQKKPHCRSIVMAVRAVLLHMVGDADRVIGTLQSPQTKCSKAIVSRWIGPSKLLKWLGKKLQFV
eukprot:g6830.t1